MGKYIFVHVSCVATTLYEIGARKKVGQLLAENMPIWYT
jgi:hypothetical protein